MSTPPRAVPPSPGAVSPALGAVVLTGGTGVRLGGVDKASLQIAGTTLLERALAATTAAGEVVVVGEPVPASRPVTWAREEPPGGGPAAGLLAGLDGFAVTPELVCVLAVDMPRVTAGTVVRLTRAVTGDLDVDAAVLVDAAGRPQPLAGVYRSGSLFRVRPRDRRDEHGLAVRRLLAGLRCAEVPAVGEETRDVDTWQDLRDLDR